MFPVSRGVEVPVPSYQSIATADYVVGSHSDDFGPYTTGTLTGGLQEALSAAGDSGSVFVRSGTYSLHRSVAQKGNNQLLICEPGVTFLAASDFAPSVNAVMGMLTLGYDGTNPYNGFVLQGNGCVFDGQPALGAGVSAGGIALTGFSQEALRFVLRDFRAQNLLDYGLIIGRANLSAFTGSVVGFVTVENFDLFNCGWIRVWAAEHVRLRHGRCRQVSNNVGLNAWFVTSQHTTTGTLMTRDVVFEDVAGDVTGGFTGYDTTLEIQANVGGSNPDVTRDIFFRRCYLKGRNSGDWYIDDAVNTTGSGVVESLTFEDCTFDTMASQSPAGRIVSNASNGYVLFDHCEFINGANLPTTQPYPTNVSYVDTRPIIVRRPTSPVTYQNQNFGITVLGSPFTYTNTHRYVAVVVVSGGTVSKIEFIPRGGTPIASGEIAGSFNVAPGDALKVTYSSLPSLTAAPWY